MSNYIAGGLMLLLMTAVALLGIEAFGIYDAARMVEAGLLDGQTRLTADGGVSPAVENLVRQRILNEGGDPARLHVGGSRPHSPAGATVRLTVAYDHNYALSALVPGGSGWRQGTFHIERTAVALSGWQP